MTIISPIRLHYTGNYDQGEDGDNPSKTSIFTGTKDGSGGGGGDNDDDPLIPTRNTCGLM